MSKLWINHMTGQQVLSEFSPGNMWSCLNDETITLTEQNIMPTQINDTDLSVGDDFTFEDDQF